jgi:hypothetical protein
VFNLLNAEEQKRQDDDDLVMTDLFKHHLLEFILSIFLIPIVLIIITNFTVWCRSK